MQGKNDGKNKRETFYREKYGRHSSFFKPKIWLTSEEMQMAEKELAVKIASEQDKTFRPQEPKTACEALHDMLFMGANQRMQRIDAGSDVGVSSNGEVHFTGSSSRTTKSFDKDTNLLLRANLACKRGLFQNSYNESRYSEKDTILNEQETKWIEDIIGQENESRRPAWF